MWVEAGLFKNQYFTYIRKMKTDTLCLMWCLSNEEMEKKNER